MVHCTKAKQLLPAQVQSVWLRGLGRVHALLCTFERGQPASLRGHFDVGTKTYRSLSDRCAARTAYLVLLFLTLPVVGVDAC